MKYACLAGEVPRVSSFSIHKVEASSYFPDHRFFHRITHEKKKKKGARCLHQWDVGRSDCLSNFVSKLHWLCNHTRKVEPIRLTLVILPYGSVATAMEVRVCHERSYLVCNTALIISLFGRPC